MFSIGYRDSDLILTRVRKKAIDQNPIAIAGAIVLRLSGRDSRGRTLETTQVCYVSDLIIPCRIVMVE